jgi:hypothetical protein
MKHILTTILYLPLIAIWLVGCSNRTTKELVVIEKDGVKFMYRAENADWSLLSFTKETDSEYVTPLSSKCTGEYVTKSDPNSIDAVSDGIIPMLIKVLKGK